MHIVIAAKSLQRGMYLSCKGQPPPLGGGLRKAGYAELDGYVLSDEGYEATLAAAPNEVRVDPTRMVLPFTGDAISVPVVHTERQRHDAYLKELEQATVLQERSLTVSRDVESRVNRGEALPVQETREVIQDMIGSLSHNRNVLLSLSRLKQWDEYTYTHSMNVALYSTLLAKYMGADDAMTEEIGVAGFFHDIGKLFVPLEIINFPGKLSDEQFKLVRKHPEYGETYGVEVSGLTDGVRRGIVEHHERYDGKGYPRGKKANEISTAGQMLLVADIYDALSSRRCYKPAMSSGDSLALMYRERSSMYAPGMLESFIKAVGVYPSGCLVRLSDNSVAIVTEQTASSLQPQVVVLMDAWGGRLKPPLLLDLSRNKKLTIKGCAPSDTVPLDLQQAVFEAS